MSALALTCTCFATTLTPDGAADMTTRVRKAVEELRLRGVPSDAKATWWALRSSPISLQLERDGADALVTLTALSAWNCGWLGIEAVQKCN